MKKTNLLLPLAFVLLALLTVSLTVCLSAADGDAVLTGDGVQQTVEDGQTVYTQTTKDSAVHYMNYNYTAGKDASKLTFDLRFNSYGTNNQIANVRAYINVTNTPGTQIVFQFIPYWHAVRIEEWKNGTQISTLAETNYPETAFDQFITFSCIFMPGYASIECSGNKVAEAVISDAYTFENTTCSFTSYILTPSMKNFSFDGSGASSAAEWIGSGFTYDTASGVYTAAKNASQKKLTRSVKTADGVNTVTFEVKPNDYQPDNDGNVGICICTAENDDAYLFLELMPKINSARARLIYKNNGSVLGRSTYVGGNDEWLSFKGVFEKDFVALYVNGKCVLSSFDTKGYSFDNVGCWVNAWKTAPSVRNIEFSHTDFDGAAYYEAGYMDLDFLTEAGLGAISCDSAAYTYNAAGKAVDFTAKQSDPGFTVSVNQPAGGRYSMYLPVRNTVLLRLKNGTSAKQIKLTLTSDDKGTAHTYEKTFEVTAGGDAQTCFFNVSDLSPVGYLKTLNIQLVGAKANETFSVESISFERETPIYAYAADGKISCIADLKAETVTVSGKLKAEYAGKEVCVVYSDVGNYDEKLSGERLAAAAAAADGSFAVTFPLKQGKGNDMTYLAAFFLAYVSDDAGNKVKLSHPFRIENYRDFYEAPVLTDIPEKTFSVLDYGAKGNAYNDDTDAIQSAVDAAAAAGGGRVVLPGDLSNAYGRRYIATNIVMKSNVELCIEEGAILWQSPRKSDYKYEPYYGHDMLSEAMWPHCGVVANYPLIQITGCENVRITGGGMIRMMDAGNEWLDGSVGYDAVDSHEIIIGCESRIHLTPIGMFNSHNVEVSDVRITRGGSWHIVMISCRDLLVQNVNINEAVCRNTDGYSIQNSQKVTVFRCSLVSNDDSVVLLPVHSDLRDRDNWWWGRIEGESNCVSDLKFIGNNLSGGLGFVFIPWGTGNPDLSQAETKDIEVYDNIFSGYQSIGCWADNPNYGYSQGASYVGLTNNPETDDYSPIKNIYMHDNRYDCSFVGLSWVKNYQYLYAQASNFVNDAGIVGSTDFLNPSFERDLRYDNEVDWVSGLSYWSSVVGDDGGVGYEKVGEKTKTAKYTSVDHVVADYAGYITGNGKLYQGIYLKAGSYVVSLKVKNPNGSLSFFVGDPINGSVSRSEKMQKCDAFTVQTFEFKVASDGVYAVGAMNEGKSSVKAYIDDASLRMTGILGDINGDGSVTVLDALISLRALLNGTDCPDADVNLDGKFSLVDILSILQRTAQ